MLVFVDESGDPGRKTTSGSSRHFAITAVLFEDKTEANNCDLAIEKLRDELQLPRKKEFRFSKNNENIKDAFFDTISPFDFCYSSFVLNKDLLRHEGFKIKETVYKYTVRHALGNLEERLTDAIVIFDKCGGRDFELQLRNYLRSREKEWCAANGNGRRRLKKVTAKSSHSNNLVQMADMVSGAIFRSFSDRKDANRYRQKIRRHEHRVQLWPKAKHAVSASKNPPSYPSSWARTP